MRWAASPPAVHDDRNSTLITPPYNFVEAVIADVTYLAPPSSKVCVPVTWADAGDERNSAIPATSCGIPKRPEETIQIVLRIKRDAAPYLKAVLTQMPHHPLS